MIANDVVMPTDVNLDRLRKRKVVFYGRVSTEHEAQLAALEIKCNGMTIKQTVMIIGSC